MNCDEAFERLLEADADLLATYGPAEIAADDGSELATHLRGCARCAAVAERILVGQRALAASLERIRPQSSADEALDRALEAVHAARARTRRRARLVALAAIPVTAAAALMALLVPPAATPPEPLPVARLAELSPTPEVRVPDGRDAIVFRTSDPKITVVWFH